MPDYEFFCQDCLTRVTREEPMLASHAPPPCPTCLTTMGRVFNSHSVCDEIRGTTYFHPDKKHEVRDHGKFFDLGLGKYVESKSQHRRLAKQLARDKGLHQLGGREV